jgi:hypothetical protein
MREEPEPLIQLDADSRADVESSSQDKNSMQFSLRRLFGFVTVGCVTLGTLITFAPRRGNIPDFIVCILSVILAVETTLAVFAACDPWLSYPSTLDERRSVFPGDPFRTNLTTRIGAILIGMLFLAIGGFVAAIIVEDNLTMDTGGASAPEQLLGLPFIAATMIGSFARGASLIGFLALLCGVRLGRDFAKHFGLCGGSFLALLLWSPTHDFGKAWAAENHGMWDAYGNLASGLVGLMLLLVCGWLAWWLPGRCVSFGRRARRGAGRLFLIGLAVGAVVGTLPAGQRLLFGNPPACLFVGAMIGSSLGAILGILTGGCRTPLPQAEEPISSASS